MPGSSLSSIHANIPTGISEELENLVREGWKNVTYEFINERVLSMPRRLQDVIDSNGKKTGW